MCVANLATMRKLAQGRHIGAVIYHNLGVRHHGVPAGRSRAEPAQEITPICRVYTTWRARGKKMVKYHMHDRAVPDRLQMLR